MVLVRYRLSGLWSDDASLGFGCQKNPLLVEGTYNTLVIGFLGLLTVVVPLLGQPAACCLIYNGWLASGCLWLQYFITFDLTCVIVPGLLIVFVVSFRNVPLLVPDP